MRFKKLGSITDQALRELNSIQHGKKLLVKTGFPMIDDHLNGLLPGDCIILSGLSGHGKSETLFRIRDNVMSAEINKDAENYIWANFNLEVRGFNVTLRSLNRRLGKKKQDILYNPFNEEELEKVKSYYDSMQDDRQFVCQDNVTAKEFYESCQELLNEHKNKKAVHISFDHAALINAPDTQKGIEDLIKYVNQLKLEYNNAYFYIVSQLNRGILGRLQERNNNSCPNAGDLYASSAMDFISSYNIIVFDAHKVGISEFMKVSADRYEYLSSYFTDEDSKGKISFHTENNLFYKVVKVRESDQMWKDLYIVEKDNSQEEKEKYKQEKKETSQLFKAPIFDKQPPLDIKFNTSTKDAFGEPEGEDVDNPF